jgi:hypothetical protein
LKEYGQKLILTPTAVRLPINRQTQRLPSFKRLAFRRTIANPNATAFSTIVAKAVRAIHDCARSGARLICAAAIAAARRPTFVNPGVSFETPLTQVAIVYRAASVDMTLIFDTYRCAKSTTGMEPAATCRITSPLLPKSTREARPSATPIELMVVP